MAAMTWINHDVVQHPRRTTQRHVIVALDACVGVSDHLAARSRHEDHDIRLLELIEKLRRAGLRFDAEPKTATESAPGFKGTTWVITGTLSQSRDEIAELIRSRSGKVSGSVSKKTSFLLAGEEAGSKLEKAKKLSVRVLDEAEFRGML